MDNLTINECRPVVLAFAVEMERKLRLNDHKGGWAFDNPIDLIKRAREELDELELVVETPAKDKIVAEAADVANFAMMVADVEFALAAPVPASAVGGLREALLRYGAHEEGCTIGEPIGTKRIGERQDRNKTCSCGFDAVLFGDAAHPPAVGQGAELAAAERAVLEAAAAWVKEAEPYLGKFPLSDSTYDLIQAMQTYAATLTAALSARAETGAGE